MFITLLDYILLPFYLVIIILIAKRIRNRNYPPGHPLRKYYLPGLLLKLGGAIFIGLIYQYYYGGADTLHYFNHAKTLNSALLDNPKVWFRLFTQTASADNVVESKYIDQLKWYYQGATYFVAKITSIVGLFAFSTYLPTSLLFAFFSFKGLWKLFVAFTDLYPNYIKSIAAACFYIPAVVIWGSGIFKDTVTIAAIGWLFHASYFGIIKAKSIFKNIITIAISLYIIYVVKVYIIMAFLPALLMWIVSKKTSIIKKSIIRIGIRSIFYIIAGLSLILVSGQLSEELGSYSIDKIIETSGDTRTAVAEASGDEGSKYDLGDFEPSLTGMMLKFPQAINVTLFRPYPWESKKIIILLSAIESFALLLFTLFVILKVGVIRLIKLFFKNAEVQFCLIFSFIFSFAIGISTYNFGSLVRYKIPGLPFYLIALFILIGESEKIKMQRNNKKIQSAL